MKCNCEFTFNDFQENDGQLFDARKVVVQVSEALSLSLDPIGPCQLQRLGDRNRIAKVHRSTHNMHESEPRLSHRLRVHESNYSLYVIGHIGVINSSKLGLLVAKAWTNRIAAGPPGQLEQTVGQRVANSVPFDHERNVVAPVCAQLLEGLPQGRRGKHFVAGNEPNLEQSGYDSRAQDFAKVVFVEGRRENGVVYR